MATTYYTYRKDVPLLPGQRVKFLKGKGYYAWPPAAAPPPPPPPPPAPPTGWAAQATNGPLGALNVLPLPGTAFLGLQCGGIGVSKTQARARFEARAAAAGRPLDLFGWKYDGGGKWADGTPGCENPLDTNGAAPGGITQEQYAINHGAIPMVAWSPPYTHAQIIAGQADVIIAKLAAYWASYGTPILLRLFVEHNLPGQVYSVVGAPNTWPGCTPAVFRASWEHVVTRFQAWAHNVGFLYCPDEGNNRDYIVSCYPGDHLCDGVAPDVYNWCSAGTVNSCWSMPLGGGPAPWPKMVNYSKIAAPNVYNPNPAWRSWSQYDIFSSGLADPATMIRVAADGALSPDLPSKKPYWVGETGCCWHSSSDTAFKAAWFPGMLGPGGVKEMPAFAGALLYDCDVSHNVDGTPTGDNNWTVDYPTSEPSILAGFVAMASDPALKGRA